MGIGQAHLQNTVGGSKAASFLNQLPWKYVNIQGGGNTFLCQFSLECLH